MYRPRTVAMAKEAKAMEIQVVSNLDPLIDNHRTGPRPPSPSAEIPKRSSVVRSQNRACCRGARVCTVLSKYNTGLKGAKDEQ